MHWDGEPFDAGGATFILGEWGGFWEEFVRGAVIENFEKTYNCTIAYDSSWPWFPKYVASGPQDPAFHMCNWNLPEMMKTARAGDYFLPIEDIKANVPHAADCWDFAFANGIGVTWAFGQYAYVYPHRPGRSGARRLQVVLGGPLRRQPCHLHHLQHPADGVLHHR